MALVYSLREEFDEQRHLCRTLEKGTGDIAYHKNWCRSGAALQDTCDERTCILRGKTTLCLQEDR